MQCSNCLSRSTSKVVMSIDGYLYLGVVILAIGQKHKDFYELVKVLRSAFTIGVGIQSRNGFVAFSFLWGVLFISLLISTYLDFK